MSARIRIVSFGVLIAFLATPPGGERLAAQGAKKKAAGRLKFEIYEDAANAFRWRLKAANGEILATSGQGYKAKGSCERGVALIKSEAATDKLTFEVYEDNAGQHRWRLKSGNGEIVASSSQGYKSRSACTHAVDLIKKGASKAEVE
jgi:uncharacterized protein YegP (UPF0339 family)